MRLKVWFEIELPEEVQAASHDDCDNWLRFNYGERCDLKTDAPISHIDIPPAENLNWRED